MNAIPVRLDLEDTSDLRSYMSVATNSGRKPKLSKWLNATVAVRVTIPETMVDGRVILGQPVNMLLVTYVQPANHQHPGAGQHHCECYDGKAGLRGGCTNDNNIHLCGNSVRKPHLSKMLNATVTGK